jgi:TolB-like protein
MKNPLLIHKVRDMPEEWKAETLDDERLALLRAHLREILDGDAFKGGKRAQEFFQLVVEHALAGRVDNLRERMLGVELFGRPVDYDTANDAVVRVKASEVRKRLAQHYRSLPAPSTIRIDLQAGSYVPQFLFEQAPPIAAAEAPNGTALAGVDDPLAARASRPHARWATWILAAAGCATILVAISVAGGYGWHRWSPAAASHPIRTLAILPLSNLSEDPKQDYFADGMTEQLIADVGQISSLRVISRTSAMTYKGTHKTLPEIARELHVDGIVEGSVDREGNRVRITAQLIDSRTDQHIWAHSYDRDMTSALELQGDIAGDIADQIRIQLTPAERAHFNRIQRVDPKAVAKDPNYATAHSALANVY